MWSHGAQLSEKKGLVKLYKKSLAEFGQLKSDRSISNLMESHWSIKGFVAHTDYSREIDH